MGTSSWRSLIRQLRKRFPVQGDVRVIRCKLDKDFGLTTVNRWGYRVRIDSSQSEQVQVDTLLHEWAHIAAIEEAYYSHTGRWGDLYGAIHEAWINNFEA